jgi:ubiquinone/menaquinone biosynthesis C-methylase UbiE
MSKTHSVTVCDLVIDPTVKARYPHLHFTEGNVEHLPFKDRSFDIVVSTNTLEHVQHLHEAISEMRRVARKQIIITVPRQRPYRYTFDLHLHFFPYPHSLMAVMNNGSPKNCEIVGGDIYYEETVIRRKR